MSEIVWCSVDLLFEIEFKSLLNLFKLLVCIELLFLVFLLGLFFIEDFFDILVSRYLLWWVYCDKGRL